MHKTPLDILSSTALALSSSEIFLFRSRDWRIENENNYNGLYEFSGVYVWGTKTKPSPNWYSDVSNQAAIYAANEEYYFGIPEEKEKENEVQLALTKKEYNYQVDLD